MTGIICAMEIEARKIIAQMSGAITDVIAGGKYVHGELYGRDAVVAVCGVGKVNAAVCAQTLIVKYSPDEIINVGVAGALTGDLKVFDVVVSTDLVQHDFDLTSIGYEPGLLPGRKEVGFKASPRIREKLCRALDRTGLHYVEGRIASGDVFVDTDAARKSIADRFSAAACEMEGAAIAQVCAINDVEFAVLRSISDSGEGDYRQFAARAADDSAQVICEYMKG